MATAYIRIYLYVANRSFAPTGPCRFDMLFAYLIRPIIRLVIIVLKAQNGLMGDLFSPVPAVEPDAGTAPVDAFALPFTARFESATRYYLLRCETDLFGELVLSRYWGSRSSRRGGEKHQWVPSPEAGRAQLARLTRARQRRGYLPVDG